MDIYMIATCFRKIAQETCIMNIRQLLEDESLKMLGRGQITKGSICEPFAEG